ncbi:MAG: chromosomal replication initiator protein DnaA [Fimbriimonadaceae bacterium]|nr:chromosomal replication initiator protein DnaA [Fimbriimonadaceae bacterium]
MDQFSLDEPQDQILLRQAWDHALARVKDRVPVTSFERFLRPLKPCGNADGRVTFMAPGKFIQEWVQEKYIELLEEALGDELGQTVTVELRVETREKPVTPTSPVKVATVPISVETSVFRPSEKYSFDRFVVGQSNRLAFAGAKAVAAAPGQKYNPLFIYGQSGLGKTHLLHGIANEILAREPGFPVTYITAQQFAEEFVHALQNNRIDQFRRAQRSVNVWLVDDIQFVAGKDKTQEEIFHTFNYLQGMGKQIVLCSDRPPRDLLLMDERLRSRFESGLVADVQMPDTETRCAIILKKAEQERVAIDHATAMYLAERVPGNVRILEGALTKLAAQASLEALPLSLELAEAMVDQYYQTVGIAKPSFDQILGMVSKHFQIDVSEIRGTSRKAPIAHARHVAVYMTREITGDSWKHIGALFGNRDHTSMMHGYKKIRDMMDRDKELNSSVRMLMRDLYPEV